MAAQVKRNEVHIKPQPGKQTQFIKSSASVVIYGGQVGGGKTWGLLQKASRHIHNKDYTAVIFRRTTPEILKPGSTWDASLKLYPLIGGKPNSTHLSYKFQSGASIKLSHMQYVDDMYTWKGTELAFIGWEELTEFEREQFIYMFSRARSMSGIRPQVVATTNPKAGSWVLEFIGWYIDPDTGYAIQERSGVIRWFIMIDDKPYFASSRQELVDEHPGSNPLSLTFITSSVFDNKILTDSNPQYVTYLEGLPKVERERLLYGNWKITPAAGNYFKREYFEIVDEPPKRFKGLPIRLWDLAGTKDPSQVSSKKKNKDPDWSVGLLLLEGDDGYFYVRHVARFRKSPLEVETSIKNIASIDGKKVKIRILHDPGQAGNYQVDNLVRQLRAYNIKGVRVTKDKITTAGAVSAQAERGNIRLVRGSWNDAFLHELENFPEGDHDDQVDALSNAYNHMVDSGIDYETLVNY